MNICRCGHSILDHSFFALSCHAPKCQCSGFSERPDCPCTMTWASPTPRPICPTHGRQVEGFEIEVPSVGPGTCIGGFAPPIYFGSDREWKDKSGHFSQETQ